MARAISASELIPSLLFEDANPPNKSRRFQALDVAGGTLRCLIANSLAFSVATFVFRL